MFIEKKDSFEWIKRYYKEKGIFIISFYPFLFAQKKHMLSFKNEFDINEFSQDTRFVNVNTPFNKEILKLSQEYQIKNVDILKNILFLKKNGVTTVVKKVYDIDDVFLEVSFEKYNDTILTTKETENEFDMKIFLSVLSGDVIMSKEKEKYIIKAVTDECSKYDLNLSNYDYYIEETGFNEYAVNLEHIISGKKIIIRNIIFNDNNKIMSIGQFKGFVL